MLPYIWFITMMFWRVFLTIKSPPYQRSIIYSTYITGIWQYLDKVCALSSTEDQELTPQL